MLRDYPREAVAFPKITFDPCVADRFQQAGTAVGQYFHQDLLVARRIYKLRPEKHLDIGSRIDGFVAHVATFRSLEVADVRPLSSTIEGVKFVQLDICDHPGEKIGKFDSVSCLHALEHFGLGRYGDELNPGAWRTALKNMRDLLLPGGKLHLSVPVGREARIEFNAQRIFLPDVILSEIELGFCVEQLDLVNDNGELIQGSGTELVKSRALETIERGLLIVMATKRP